MRSLKSVLPDFGELSKLYAGQWVALDPTDFKVVASGDTALQVYSVARDKGIAEPMVTRVAANYGYMAPCLT